MSVACGASEITLARNTNQSRDHADELRAELARLDTEVARLAGAIAAGGDMAALV